VDIGSRLNSAENLSLMCIRAGNKAEKAEKVGLDRVGLWKQPSLGPNIRLLESCGVGGECGAPSHVNNKRSFDHVVRYVVNVVNECGR